MHEHARKSHCAEYKEIRNGYIATPFLCEQPSKIKDDRRGQLGVAMHPAGKYIRDLFDLERDARHGEDVEEDFETAPC